MTIVNLYKTGTSVGPTPSSEGQSVHGYRLVADEGKVLTGGETVTHCIDIAIADLEAWSETDDPGEDEEIEWDEVGKILAGEDGE